MNADRSRRLTAILKKGMAWLAVSAAAGLLALAAATRVCLLPLPASPAELTIRAEKPRLLDRYGIPLTVTYTNDWNSESRLALHQVPEFLQTAVILSEDKRFFSHSGPDWIARFHALFQNLMAGSVVRGASTITEQVVRMIHPRPRTVWSRWLEGIEAMQLEARASKSDILEFYLNQVPFAANRRGIAQAARYYFDRSPDTLSRKEMLALIILIRAPSGYDLYRNPRGIHTPLARLSKILVLNTVLTRDEADTLLTRPFSLKKPELPVSAPHFARFAYESLSRERLSGNVAIRTTLDGNLQTRVSRLLSEALARLDTHGVRHGAALVVDHTQGEILAWAVETGAADAKTRAPDIDAVITPRQPGSSLKPFVYALALQKGWTAATLIHDTPLMEKVGAGGLHTYHNYSRRHYGPVTLRQALGNSLNIPAVRALQFTGLAPFLETLHRCGIQGLTRHPDYYGDGLALGNGEVSLLELVQAYTVLANAGLRIDLSFTFDAVPRQEAVFSPEVSSLISNILADPGARTLEFGSGSLLAFPVETAVKTGTSSDYRDSWATGYSSSYTAGVWMGNLDGTPTLDLTGSRGPALVLRSIFSELSGRTPTRPLFLSPKLVTMEIPIPQDDHSRTRKAATRTEWFIPGTQPEPGISSETGKRFGFVRPVNGLQLAMDPRIPDSHEVIEFLLAGLNETDTVSWLLDGTPLDCLGKSCLWHLSPGRHSLRVTLNDVAGRPGETDHITFMVK